jgi:hypothetical protein
MQPTGYMTSHAQLAGLSLRIFSEAGDPFPIQGEILTGGWFGIGGRLQFRRLGVLERLSASIAFR